MTEFVPAATQLKALDALLKTTTTDALKLPESLMKNIPPRPLGYVRHRELIKIRTELTFDPISLAETAADLTYSLILHPARANRLVEYHGRDQSQPSLEMVLDKIISQAFRSAPQKGHDGNIQMSSATAALMNLAKLSVHPDATAQVKAITMMKLDQLKASLTRPNNFQPDESWRAFNVWCASVIDRLKSEPDEFKSAPALPAPPGQPIGSDEEYLCPTRSF